MLDLDRLFVTRNWFGKAVRRNEDARFVKGEATYVDGLDMDCAHVAILRSIFPHARIKRIDTRPTFHRFTALTRAAERGPLGGPAMLRRPCRAQGSSVPGCWARGCRVDPPCPPLSPCGNSSRTCSFSRFSRSTSCVGRLSQSEDFSGAPARLLRDRGIRLALTHHRFARYVSLYSLNYKETGDVVPGRSSRGRNTRCSPDSGSNCYTDLAHHFQADLCANAARTVLRFITTWVRMGDGWTTITRTPCISSD